MSRQTPPEKMPRPADAPDVTEPLLYKAYQTIREQISDELLISLVKGASAPTDDDIRQFATLTQKTLFAPFYNTESEGLVGLGSNAARGQQLLGSVLADSRSQTWIAWFLAYPVDRKRPDNFLGFRVSLQLEEPDMKAKAKSIPSFFDEQNRVDNVLYAARLFADLDRAIEARIETLPKSLIGMSNTPQKLTAAVFIDFVARFVLLEAPYLPALSRTFDGLNQTNSLDEYTLTYFALGFGLKLASQVQSSQGLELAPSELKEATKFGQLAVISEPKKVTEYGSSAQPKLFHYAWTLFPYRVNVSVGHMLYLIWFVTKDQNMQSLGKSFFEKTDLGNFSTSASKVTFKANIQNYISNYENGSRSVEKRIRTLRLAKFR